MTKLIEKGDKSIVTNPEEGESYKKGDVFTATTGQGSTPTRGVRAKNAAGGSRFFCRREFELADEQFPRTITFDEIKKGDRISAKYLNADLITHREGVAHKLTENGRIWYTSKDFGIVWNDDDKLLEITLLERTEKHPLEGAKVGTIVRNTSGGQSYLHTKQENGKWTELRVDTIDDRISGNSIYHTSDSWVRELFNNGGVIIHLVTGDGQ